MKQKILFMLILLGITTIFFLSNISKPIQTGTVKDIQEKSGVTIIRIEEQNESLVIFDKKPNLGIGDKIKFQGKNSTYENQNQITIEKIWKISTS